MDARQRRIMADLERVRVLCVQCPRIEMLAWSDAASRMVVEYRCRGLVWLPGHPAPSVLNLHQMALTLHADYPRRPPRVAWLTEIFHPNILGRSANGGVCVGPWTPAETLDQLVLRIGEMVQYKSFNTADALNPDAAAWADQNRSLLPVDRESLLSRTKGQEK